MAKLSSDWWNAFRGCFNTQEDVIDFIFENIDTTGWETSYIDAAGYGEPNEMFKSTPQDKKDLLYMFMMELIGDKA